MFDIFIDIFFLLEEENEKKKKHKNAWGCANNIENQKPHSNIFICFADFYLMCAARRKTKSWIETCLHISRYEAYISNNFFLYAYKVRAKTRNVWWCDERISKNYRKSC